MLIAEFFSPSWITPNQASLWEKGKNLLPEIIENFCDCGYGSVEVYSSVAVAF